MVGIENKKKKAPPCAGTHEGADSHKVNLCGYDTSWLLDENQATLVTVDS